MTFKIFLLSTLLFFLACSQASDNNRSPASRGAPLTSAPSQRNDSPVYVGGSNPLQPSNQVDSPSAVTAASATPNQIDEVKKDLAPLSVAQHDPSLDAHSELALCIDDNDFLVTSNQIDALFKDLVESKASCDSAQLLLRKNEGISDLGITSSQAYKDASLNYEKNLKSMKSFRSALLKLSQDPTTSSQYNQAMYQYFLSTWTTNCYQWSSIDDSNCPTGDTRQSSIDKSGKAFDNVKTQIYAELDQLPKIKNRCLDNVNSRGQ